MSAGAAAEPRGFSVLLVEDDLALARTYTRALKGAGATRVVPATTVAEANACLGAERFDICWIDLGLPDGRGTEVVKHAIRVSPASVLGVVSGAAAKREPHELGWDHVDFFDKLETSADEIIGALLARLELARGVDDRDVSPLRVRLRRIEQDLVKAALDEHAGNVSATARALGVSRETLQLLARRRGLPRRSSVTE